MSGNIEDEQKMPEYTKGDLMNMALIFTRALSILIEKNCGVVVKLMPGTKGPEDVEFVLVHYNGTHIMVEPITKERFIAEGLKEGDYVKLE